MPIRSANTINHHMLADLCSKVRIYLNHRPANVLVASWSNAPQAPHRSKTPTPPLPRATQCRGVSVPMSGNNPDFFRSFCRFCLIVNSYTVSLYTESFKHAFQVSTVQIFINHNQHLMTLQTIVQLIILMVLYRYTFSNQGCMIYLSISNCFEMLYLEILLLGFPPQSCKILLHQISGKTYYVIKDC